jgi:hypothetical protein
MQAVVLEAICGVVHSGLPSAWTVSCGLPVISKHLLET